MTSVSQPTLLGVMTNFASHINPFSSTSLLVPTEGRPRQRSSHAILESDKEEEKPVAETPPRKQSFDLGIDLSIFEAIFSNNEAVDHF